MLAHHPVTGKEVRVLQTDASLWKERKTLAWVPPDGAVPPWSTVSSDQLAGGVWPEFVITETRDVAASASQHVKVVFVTGKRIEGIPNCMSLRDMAEAYPHLGAAWDGTREDAVVMIAGLLRYRRVAGAWSGRAESLGLVREGVAPARLWWVTQYYHPSTAVRDREITTCLRRNAASVLIDRVILLNEKRERLPEGLGSKVSEEVIGARLTYKAVLEWIASAAVPADVIVAFANADICIDDDSWRELWSVNLEGKFLALLRYDVPSSGSVEDAVMFGPRADSQDTWVVRAADVKAAAAAAWSGFDIPFGKMGCDNAVALEMFRAKFLVVNPALSLKTWHFHASGVRNYVKTDVVERPVFLYLSPTGFHDLQPVSKWSELAAGEMVKVDGKPALRLGTCFGTAGGLVFDRCRLFIGPAKESVAEWSAMELHGLTPSMECKKGVVAPWPGGAEESREVYVLRYLARILRLRREAGWEEAEFLCPETAWGAETLSVFRWLGLSTMPVMKYDSEVQTWYREALVYPIVDGDALCREDVVALRGAVRGWTSGGGGSGPKRRLVLVEGGALTAQIADDVEEILEKTWSVKRVYAGRSSADRMRDMLVGAWGVVCAAGLETTGWNWLLPCGGYVFELAVGVAKKPEGAVLSACAELNHMEVRVRAGLPPLDVASEIIREVASAERNTRAAESGLPVVWMPRKDLEGYFGHPGDSFREMVRLWGERGWVQVREHATATMVWWGAVGADGVLLYDRPNHDWRLAAPTVEQSWRRGLFGNPRPPIGSAIGSAKPWSFWPRRPELVEAIVADGVKGWDARTRGLVFYGKIENKVQERRRTAADWSEVGNGETSEWVSNATTLRNEWVLVRGDEPYPFTQREYLERLATAKFGLCLAGYGLKCHREVECMAMGCVPLVAPEVDMDSYAVPPREGVEYLRVSDPAAAAAAAASMDRETWERMSAAGQAWWRANASCEGMFALTKKLAEE